jgi:thioredoxin-like negative regulator of GroEL
VPVVEKVAAELQGKVDFYYVDLDRDISMAQAYDIMAVPVLIRVRNGQEVDRLEGYVPEAEVRAFAEG